jgi:hypothetical protein
MFVFASEEQKAQQYEQSLREATESVEIGRATVSELALQGGEKEPVRWRYTALNQYYVHRAIKAYGRHVRFHQGSNIRLPFAFMC